MRAAILASALLLAGCSTPRLLSYGTQLADAKVVLPTGEAFSIYVHPTESVLLVQARLAQTGPSQRWGLGVWRAGAEALINPVGCGVQATKYLTTGSWEATYACPPDVNLRALIIAQRLELSHGAALHR